MNKQTANKLAKAMLYFQLADLRGEGKALDAYLENKLESLEMLSSKDKQLIRCEWHDEFQNILDGLVGNVED